MDYSANGKFSFGEEYTAKTGQMTTLYLQAYKETVRKFILALDIRDGDVLTFGDYGGFDGFSTLDIIFHISDLLKKTKTYDVPVNVIYEDIPSNDFNALVKTVNSNREIMGKQKIFFSMCPVGFYDQCQPANTFHVIASSFAVHFLSRSVCYKNSLYKHPDATSEERKAAEKQAAADWITFLCLRAKEMKSGAMMMLTMPVEDQKNSHVHLERLWTLMTEVWRQMKVEEHISELEYETTNYQGYYRSGEELRAPFQEGSTVHSAGLYIQSLDIVHRHNHSRLCLPDDDVCSEEEKQEAWAHSLIQTIREWTEYIFLDALDQRSAPSRRKLIDTFYTRLVNKLKCEDREDSGWDNIICYLVIRKR